MINKKILMLGTILVLSIFLISIISAQEYCCEKTNAGAWCQNAPENECDTTGDLRAVPTSCEATSYCRLGVCINSEEGTCMPNTPQKVCDENNGVWDERDKDEIPQCQLGCCLIGEQAAFVTLTRCKSLASDYGLEINYRMDIQSETECIANARPKVKGACVYEKEYEKTCKLLTKKECQEMQASFETEFHEGYLCSATNLNTNCAATTKTTCVEGRDEVYFLDSCGNLANVYDAKKEKKYDDNYWTYIAGTKAGVEVCSPASDTCGNCDYFSGTTCKAVGGRHICKDLGCEDIDFKNKYKRNPEHGETWCADAKGIDKSLPGSRHFRLVCYNGEVSVEPCADFRQEVCIQSFIGEQPTGGFKTAACRVNMWQDCYSQDNEKDCENIDKRDCKWIEGISILRDEEGNSLVVNETTGEEIEASCVPLHAPGFDFWEEGTDAESMCSLASATCVVNYEAGISEGWKKENAKVIPNEQCMENCVETECGVALHVWREMRPWSEGLSECEKACQNKCIPECVYKNSGDEWKLDEDKWASNMSNMCISLGDCGSSTNYIGEDGYYDLDDFITRSGEEEEE